MDQIDLKTKFWIVWSDRGKATKQHATKQSAIEEATRLCKKEDSVFYVMEAVNFIHQAPHPVEVNSYE